MVNMNVKLIKRVFG